MNRIVVQLGRVLHREKTSPAVVVLAAVLTAGVVMPSTGQGLRGEGFQTHRYDFRAAPPALPPASAPAAAPAPPGRLTARELGLVINTADPYSVQVGAYYATARRLLPSQVLRTTLPVTAELSPEQFKALQGEIASFFGERTQALALAWTKPYAVGCNAITGALALGFDAELCRHTCAASASSPYFNARTAKPRSEFGFRPSMLLAARDVAGAKAMIDRGVAADGRLGQRGAPPAVAYFVKTRDAVRNARVSLFPPPSRILRANVEVRVETTDALDHPERVLIYETGATNVAKLDTIGWLPGALADHLTSYGGDLDGHSGQMPATDWIASGATASYGTVSEPCAHPQKFPHPQVLLLHYLLGETAIEAYWKSVAWPQQGLFIGEPLAAPFARR